jgi:hypothetical protein
VPPPSFFSRGHNLSARKDDPDVNDVAGDTPKEDDDVDEGDQLGSWACFNSWFYLAL